MKTISSLDKEVKCYKKVLLENSCLIFQDLSDKKFKECVFRNCTFKNCSFEKTEFWNTTFQNCGFYNCDFMYSCFFTVEVKSVVFQDNNFTYGFMVCEGNDVKLIRNNFSFAYLEFDFKKIGCIDNIFRYIEVGNSKTVNSNMLSDFYLLKGHPDNFADFYLCKSSEHGGKNECGG